MEILALLHKKYNKLLLSGRAKLTKSHLRFLDSYEEYGLKSYIRTMNMASAHTFFAARSQMLKGSRPNFPHSK